MRFVDPERYGEMKATGKLPSPEGVAFAIIKLLQRDDFRIADLVHLVQSDPAIAGRLLKFSNAAAFGRSRPIVSLQRAIIALGSFRVRDLVIGFSVLQANRSGQCQAFDYAGFWARSLAMAIACQELSRYAQIAGEENFTIGLLARVGELGLAALYPDAYSEILDTLGEVPDPTQLREMEQRRFGIDHRELGASMLSEWGLPEVLIEATYCHEAPGETSFPEGSRFQILTESLSFARELAELCTADEGRRWRLLPGLVTRAAALGVGSEDLAVMADRVVERWREWGAMLHVRTRDLPPFAELLAANPPLPRAGGGEGAPEEGAQSVLLVAPPGPEVEGLTVALTELGYGTHLVCDAEAALLAALHAPPRLVVADVDLPGLDLPGFCQALRGSTTCQDCYLMVLAGNGEAGDAEARVLAAMDAGADDVLHKPGAARQLRVRLAAAQRVLQLRQEVRQERRGIVRSADEFAGVRRRLTQVASTDALTQLPNRRHGLDYLASEWVFAGANGLPMAALMIDIDHFKAVNDRHGHSVGDGVLRQLATRLRHGSRSEDMVFRYGGEEFAVILPGAHLRTALQVAERIRLLVAASPCESTEPGFPRLGVPVTVSIGAAWAQRPQGDSLELIKAADQALYRAKEGGRNRVVSGRVV